MVAAGREGQLLAFAAWPLLGDEVQGYASRFRLNENLAAALICTSTLAALLLAPLVAAASALAADRQPASAAAPAVAPPVVEGEASGDQQQEQDRPPKGKVRMVYSGQGASEEVPGEQPQSSSLEQQQGEPPAAGQQQEQQLQHAKRGSAFEDIEEPSAAAGSSMRDGDGNGGATSVDGSVDDASIPGTSPQAIGRKGASQRRQVLPRLGLAKRGVQRLRPCRRRVVLVVRPVRAAVCGPSPAATSGPAYWR
ncbi:hypothetical protein N2152v2_009661 [Parachlorella kessleri]